MAKSPSLNSDTGCLKVVDTFRFIVLADANARLGANAVCYSFIAVDFHHLLPAGFSGAPVRKNSAPSSPRARSLRLIILFYCNDGCLCFSDVFTEAKK